MSLEALIDSYCEAWSTSDPDRRRANLENTLTPDVIYTDPSDHVIGTDALSEHIGSVLEEHPGGRVERVSAVDHHHDLARFAWQFVKADGDTLVEGLDVVTVDGGSGKLRSIAGFFGTLRAGT